MRVVAVGEKVVEDGGRSGGSKGAANVYGMGDAKQAGRGREKQTGNYSTNLSNEQEEVEDAEARQQVDTILQDGDKVGERKQGDWEE